MTRTVTTLTLAFKSLTLAMLWETEFALFQPSCKLLLTSGTCSMYQVFDQMIDLDTETLRNPCID